MERVRNIRRAEMVCSFILVNHFSMKFLIMLVLIAPRREKTGLRGFQPGPTQTGLYNQRKWLDA